MSQHNHYIKRSRAMSMAELNHNKTLSLRLEAHLRSMAIELNDSRYTSQAERVHYCSTFWQGRWCPTCGKFHDMHTTGCKHRLCPICVTRASRVTAMQAIEAVNYIRKNHPSVSFSLLTLTQRNVSGPDLNNEVNRLLKGWSYLCNQRSVRNDVWGWAKTVEIVPALHDDGMYHPHVHAILAHGDKCPSAAWFRDKWRAGLGLDYDPVCDLRPIVDEDSAVFEVSKYISKMSRIYDGSAREHEHVRYLAEAISARRLRSYGGEWRLARQMLGQMNVEEMDADAISEYGEMISAEGTCPKCGSATEQAVLRWAGLRYVGMPHDMRVISFPTSFVARRRVSSNT